MKGVASRIAGFEERHPGLHLGLGGDHGSHHLDLIFAAGGTLALDDRIVFDGAFAV